MTWPEGNYWASVITWVKDNVPLQILELEGQRKSFIFDLKWTGNFNQEYEDLLERFDEVDEEGDAGYWDRESQRDYDSSDGLDEAIMEDRWNGDPVYHDTESESEGDDYAYEEAEERDFDFY